MYAGPAVISAKVSFGFDKPLADATSLAVASNSAPAGHQCNTSIAAHLTASVPCIKEEKAMEMVGSMPASLPSLLT